MPSGPVLRSISPETPKLWGGRGDCEPVVANEEEVVRLFLEPIEITLGGDVPLEDTAEHFGWEFRNVQQRVSGAFEPRDSRLVLPDLLIQG